MQYQVLISTELSTIKTFTLLSKNYPSPIASPQVQSQINLSSMNCKPVHHIHNFSLAIIFNQFTTVKAMSTSVIARSTGTAQTSAKARLTSAAIWQISMNE